MKAHFRALLHAVPFQPFLIRVADGRGYHIENLDFVLASATEMPQVIVKEADGRTHFLSVLLIASGEQVPAATVA